MIRKKPVDEEKKLKEYIERKKLNSKKILHEFKDALRQYKSVGKFF